MEKGCNTSCCSSSSGLSVSDKKSSTNSLFVTNSTTKICMPGGTHGGGGGGENLARSKNPFAHSAIPLYNKSPGGGSSMEEGYEYHHPFTCVQWKELERQAMIYKYMISSVPVPLDLLFPPPIIINSSTPPPPPPNIYSPAVLYNNNVSRYSKTGDLEPGRCKRTDGKKWRCSRDVAPTQKYCDRHLHRGRPRSRKPVETTSTTLPLNNNNNNIILNPHKKIRTSHHQINVPPNPNPNPNSNSNANANEPLLFFSPPKSDLANRGLVLNDVVLEGKEGFSDYRPIFHEDYSRVFCNQNFSPPQIEVPNNGFIDAWSSIDDYNLNSSSNGCGSNLNVQSLNNGDLSPTSLNLSIGSRVKESAWFAGGGPLGEALSSPAATTVSSPSGVLQRTMFSHSDGGSVCNSPTTFVADAPLHWLN
ncbi:hypothetical protein ABFS83_06G097500 [Erythranthe nasuta]